MIESTKQERDPEAIHDEVLRLEDEMMPILTKVRDAINKSNKYVPNEDEDVLERIESLEYFKNQSGQFMQWIDKYMRYNEELRDIFIGSALKNQLNDVLYSQKKNSDELKAVRRRVILLNNRLKEQVLAKRRLDQDYNAIYDDLSNYYDKYHNITLKEWFKLRILSKFKRSRN
jgi:hypothetical protein